jgi:MFS family permease
MSESRVRGLWAPQTRALTASLVLTVTFVASEALAVVTVTPAVVRDLGGLRLYGWVFSAFMLGSVIGIVVAGREADRRGPAIPFVGGLVPFASGLAVAGLAPSNGGCWSRAGCCGAWAPEPCPRWPMPRSAAASPDRSGPA